MERERVPAVKARDLLPILQAHPDADIMIIPWDYDIIGGTDGIKSVEYELFDGDEAIVVTVQ